MSEFRSGADYGKGYDQGIDDMEAEIAKLRAALEEIVATVPPERSPDWFMTWKQLFFAVKGIARKALANEQEGK
jgi:hypothetical protein